ncbi:MAG: carbon storage regulator [Candidatus Neomarinimicrobiota bacterium]|nr:MAG: carbon storage regulator [Candidatus Neomarinimicrobiota bacterium]
MLILTRKSGEKIRIGNDILIQPMKSGKGKVKIGITAPDNVPIYREELYLQIQTQNQEARLEPELQIDVLEQFSQESLNNQSA